MYQEPPPTRPVAARGPPPFAGAVWIPGHWAWAGQRYVWVSGRWARGREGYIFVPPRWERHGGGWVRVEGHWVPAARPAPDVPP